MEEPSALLPLLRVHVTISHTQALISEAPACEYSHLQIESWGGCASQNGSLCGGAYCDPTCCSCCGACDCGLLDCMGVAGGTATVDEWYARLDRIEHLPEHTHT